MFTAITLLLWDRNQRESYIHGLIHGCDVGIAESTLRRLRLKTNGRLWVTLQALSLISRQWLSAVFYFLRNHHLTYILFFCTFSLVWIGKVELFLSSSTRHESAPSFWTWLTLSVPCLSMQGLTLSQQSYRSQKNKKWKHFIVLYLNHVDVSAKAVHIIKIQIT